MKFLATFILFLCFISEGFTQKSLNDFSYVIVPDKFDFVNEKDKYQLNSLTKFLFNKHGFNAFFESERPNAKRCDGLYAVVEGKPAMIRTKVTIILNDCYGDEVYRSEVGKSKLKAYNKTYTAALRQAFLSIEALEIDQKEPEIFGETEAQEVEEKPVVVEAETVDSEEKIDSKSDTVMESAFLAETEYVSNGSNFSLKTTKSGYRLYEKSESGETLKGTLIIKGGKTLEFEDPAGNIFPAHFDSEENLIILTSFQRVEFIKQG